MALIFHANATFKLKLKKTKNRSLEYERLNKNSGLLKSTVVREAPRVQKSCRPTPMDLVEPAGIEPATSCLQSRRSPS